MRIDNLEFKWLGHSSFYIKEKKVIYIDPYNILRREPADLILLTHPHYDHCSIADINKIVKDGTIIVGPAGCQSKIARLDKKIKIQLMEVGQTIEIFGIQIETVPAYNLSKPHHPKEEGWFGYVLDFGSLIIYHAGDTDLIPEMKSLGRYNAGGKKFVALLPVSGGPTMNPEEAAEAASIIQPSLAFPMHWGAGVAGEKSDADNFVNLCKEKGIKAEILIKE